MNSIINVIMIKIIVMNNRLLDVIQLITIHFGINPINGGSPPKDIKFLIRVNFTSFELFMILISWFI